MEFSLLYKIIYFCLSAPASPTGSFLWPAALLLFRKPGHSIQSLASAFTPLKRLSHIGSLLSFPDFLEICFFLCRFLWIFWLLFREDRYGKENKTLFKRIKQVFILWLPARPTGFCLPVFSYGRLAENQSDPSFTIRLFEWFLNRQASKRASQLPAFLHP